MKARAVRLTWMQRWMAAEWPGLISTAMGFLVLTAGLVLITLSRPAALIPGIDREMGWWLVLVLLLLWPFCSLVTHSVAIKTGLSGSFQRVLLVTGRAWLLHAAALVVVNASLAIFEEAGWQSWADFCHLTLKGGIIWLVYPAALRESYGREARTLLLTLITGCVVLLFLLLAFWLAYLSLLLILT